MTQRAGHDFAFVVVVVVVVIAAATSRWYKLPRVQELPAKKKAAVAKKSAAQRLSIEALLADSAPSELHASELQQQLRAFLEYPRSLHELREWFTDEASLAVGASDLLQELKTHPSYSISQLPSVIGTPSLLDAHDKATSWLLDDG